MRERTTIPGGLKGALLFDAAASAAMGVLLIAASGPLSGMLGLPAGLLRWAGLVLVPFAAVLGWMGTRPRVSPGAAWAIIGCNVLWAADSGILLMSGWVDPTLLGTAFVLVQGAAVGAFAWMEHATLRHAVAAA